MGAEFAREFPKVAARLGMDGTEVADPYVERLLEGAAFLAARVQLKLDAEFPRFTQRLLEIVYRAYLAPTPSMAIVQLQPQLTEGNLARGVTVRRGSAMRAQLQRGQDTACEFRTAHDVTLWPLEVAAAEYFLHAPDLPIARSPFAQSVRAGLRVRLRVTAGLRFADLPLDRLQFFLGGSEEIAFKLYELCAGHCLGAMVLSPARPAPWTHTVAAADISGVGFADERSPAAAAGFGLRRAPIARRVFRLRAALSVHRGRWPARRRQPGDRQRTGARAALFPFRQLARGPGRGGQHGAVLHAGDQSVPEAARPHPSLRRRARVPRGARPDPADGLRGARHHVGHRLWRGRRQRTALPAAVWAAARRRARQGRVLHRAARTASDVRAAAARRRALRLSRLGGVHRHRRHRRSAVSLRSASAGARGAVLEPRSAAAGRLWLGQHGFRARRGGPAGGDPPDQGSVATGLAAGRWRAHLADDQPAVAELPGADRRSDRARRAGAVVLSEILRLYAPSADASSLRQIQGLRSVRAQRTVARLPIPGPIAFGRGVQIDLEVDELAFEGAGAFLFGSVLEHFLARHASLNSFVATTLRTTQRGEVARWRPRCGTRPIL